MIEKLLGTMNSLPYDKALHGFYGMILYGTISLYDSLVALLIVIAFAVSKEVYDSFESNHTSDKYDFIATITVPAILYFLELIIKGIKW